MGGSVPIIRVRTPSSDGAVPPEPPDLLYGRWKPRNVNLLAVILLMLIIASPFGINVSRLSISASWNLSCVGHWASSESSMAVDGQGYVHLVYVDSSGLVYASNSGGRWHNHSFGFFSEFASVAVDSAGAAYIAATEYTSYGRVLTYLTDASGSWVSIQVNSTVMGWPLSIALDANRVPHITYPTGTDAWENGKLMYSTIVNGTWMTEEIPFGFSEGWSSDIAVDSNGHVHIVAGDGGVVYVTNAGGNWSIEGVFGTDLTLDSVSIALDQNNSPRIAYYGGNSLAGQWGLQYAVRTNDGKWMSTMVEHVESMNWPSCSIAIDSQNNAHIAYTNGQTGVLKYVKIIGTTMTNTTIGVATQGITSCSIGINAQDRVDISYADVDGTIIFATNAPPPMIYHMILMAAVWKGLASAPVVLGYVLWYSGRRRLSLRNRE